MKKSTSTKVTALILAILLSTVFSLGTVSSTEAWGWSSVKKAAKKVGRTVKKGAKKVGKAAKKVSKGGKWISKKVGKAGKKVGCWIKHQNHSHIYNPNVWTRPSKKICGVPHREIRVGMN